MVGSDEQGGTNPWGRVPPPPSGEVPPPPAGTSPPAGAPAAGSDDYPGGTGWQDGGSTDLGGPDGMDPGSSPFPPPRRRIRIGTILRFGFLAVIAGSALYAWLGSADRDGDGSITRAGDLAATELRAGDCFDDPGMQEEIDGVRALPCDEPHDHEIYHEFEHADGDAPPSPEVVNQRIGEECVRAFDTFVGTVYMESDLDFFTFEPTEEGWRQGDRTVQCALYAMDGSKLNGSARDARR